MTLSPQTPGLLTAKQLAARWGVTTPTVRNYRNAGMAIAGKNHDGAEVYDPVFCDDWREKHKPNMGHGGRRPGSGKKKAVPDEIPADESLIAEAQKTAAKLKTEHLNLTDAGQILDSWARGEVNPTLAKTGLVVLQTASERVELDKRMGTLVDRAEVERLIGEHLNVIRTTVDGLPTRMAAAVMGELALPAEVLPRLRAVLEEQVRRLCESLAENPLAACAAAAAA